MKELSLNILDIAQNSIKAGAKKIDITITENNTSLTFTVTDDGCGMSPEFLARVTDPFTTTRTTRKVGLGLPLLKMEAEQSGGSLTISSKTLEHADHGTVVTAVFMKDSIDYTPLGDIVGTFCVLIQGAKDIDLTFTHILSNDKVTLSTAEMREMLGDVPLDTPEVITWVRDYLNESYQQPETSGLE